MKASKEYIDLVRELPLVPIDNKTEYKAALDMLTKLGIKDFDMTADERDYFRILDMIIRDYEKERSKTKVQPHRKSY